MLYDDSENALSIGILYAHADMQLRAVCLALPMKYEDKKLMNPKVLAALRNVTGKFAPDVDEWVPLAVASARAKLELLKTSSDGTTEVVISERLSGKQCDLLMTRLAPKEDGCLYSFLTLLVY